MPSVSVLVPVRNEARSIEQTLRSLLTQDYPDKFEVIVADGLSEDETVPIIRRLQGEFANLKLVFNPSRLSSAGRNMAVRHMTGEVAVVVDGHCHVPDKHYLRNLATAFEASQADCIGRPQPLDLPDPTLFQAAVAVARASRLGHNPESDIYSNEPKFVPPQSTAVAYRAQVFGRIGMFDEAFDACEDVEFNQRVDDAKLTCYFSPAVKIVYHPRKTWLALVKQLARYGSGRARLAAKNPRSLSVPALVPPLWFLWLIIGGLASFAAMEVFQLYLASLALYGAVILGGSVYLGRGKSFKIAVRIPGVFVGIHFGFAWGFLREVGRILAVRGTGPIGPARMKA